MLKIITKFFLAIRNCFCLVFVSFCFLAFVIGCFDDVENKPALYWYQEMLSAIRMGELEKADEMYISLSSEHVNSPLLPEAIFILATEHMNSKEYLLANFYYEEYLKRFSAKKNRDFIGYMKIKSSILSLVPYRNQELILDTISDIQSFLDDYPNSAFRHEISTLYIQACLSELSLNNKVSYLYKKTGHIKAQRFYTNKSSCKNLGDIKYDDVSEPLYKRFFYW